MSVHEDTLKGLQEAFDYVKGDKSKGRLDIVEIPDDEIEFYSQYSKLSNNAKQAMHTILSEMLKASNQ